VDDRGAMQRPGVVTIALALLACTAVLFGIVGIGMLTDTLGTLARPSASPTWSLVVAIVGLSGACAAGGLGLWLGHGWARRFSIATLVVFALLFLTVSLTHEAGDGALPVAAFSTFMAVVYAAAAVALWRSGKVRRFLLGRSANPQG
jgi:hypothetical protein